MIELPEPGRSVIRTLPSNNTVSVTRDQDGGGVYVQHVVYRLYRHPHKVEYWDDPDPITVGAVLHRIEQREGLSDGTVLWDPERQRPQAVDQVRRERADGHPSERLLEAAADCYLLSEALLDANAKLRLMEYPLPTCARGESQEFQLGLIFPLPSYGLPEFGRGFAGAARGPDHELGLVVFPP